MVGSSKEEKDPLDPNAKSQSLKEDPTPESERENRSTREEKNTAQGAVGAANRPPKAKRGKSKKRTRKRDQCHYAYAEDIVSPPMEPPVEATRAADPPKLFDILSLMGPPKISSIMEPPRVQSPSPLQVPSIMKSPIDDNKQLVNPKPKISTPQPKKKMELKKVEPKKKPEPVKRQLNPTGTRELLNIGEKVTSENAKWKILKVLGSGGFGDVYKVVKEGSSDNTEYAMKTEMVSGDKHILRLKIEVMVLCECSAVFRTERKKHFVEIVDKGKNQKFKFLVMGLVGLSLYDMRKTKVVPHFSRSTAMLASMQTLQAVWDLHLLGWLHRDIKPQNFAVGLGKQDTTVFILDFGIAKRLFIKGTTNAKLPRARVNFFGTIKFASRAAQDGFEQGRKDDVEAWLYMAYDLFDNEHGLPWIKFEKKDILRVLPEKEKFFKHEFSRCYSIVPKDFRGIVNYINSLFYSDEPDYKLIMSIMQNAAVTNKIDMTKQPDWKEVEP